jgi:tetratricopeptide (TPR) repeat protein
MQRAIHRCSRGLIVFAYALACLQAGLGDESTVDQRLLRVQQWIQSGDLPSARNELRELLAPHQSDPRIYNLLGVIDAQQNDLQAAESNFRRAIQIAPRFTGAYLNLGRLLQEHIGQGATAEKALEAYQGLLAFDPSQVEANYQAASLLNRLDRFGPSLARLERLPPEARQRAQALALLCSDNAALGRRSQAETASRQLAQASDLTEQDILPILPTLHDHSADDLATVLMETLAQRGVISKVGWQALAALQERKGRFKEARESLEKDLQLEPPSAPVLIRLAKLAYQSADLEGSLGYLAHARDLEPQNAAIHFFFGLVCVDLKLPPEAKQSLVEAVRLDPGNPYYHYALGAVLLQEKKADEAIPHFLKYRAEHSDDPRGAFALGVAYFDAYQPDAARRELEAAADRPETRAGANLYLGRLAFRAGNRAEAEDRFQQATRSNPSSPDPLAEISLIQIDKQEFGLAENNLKKALQNAPNDYRSNLNLLMLYQRTKDPRAEQQALRVKQLEKAGEERELMLLRSLEIRP